MASGRAADREDPCNSRRNSARSLDRDPISELHQGGDSKGSVSVADGMLSEGSGHMNRISGPNI